MALTLGAVGRLVLDQGAVTRIDNSHKPTVLDTSGAGEAFNGAYLAATLRGASALIAAKDGLCVAPEWPLKPVQWCRDRLLSDSVYDMLAGSR